MTATLAPAPPMIGPDYCPLAAHVPEEIADAIDAHERAVARSDASYASYRLLRDGGLPGATEQFAEYLEWCRVVDMRRRLLEEAVPVVAGWYPHAGRVWGWAKRSKGGLELVSEPAACPLAGPASDEARRAWYAGAARKAAQDRRIAEFMNKGD